MANVQENVTNFSIGIGPISLSAKNAQKAGVWAEGTDEQVAELGGVHSAKGWATSAEGYASDPNIVACGTNISSINTVAGNVSDVNNVAGISGDVSKVSGISADVTTVAGKKDDISTCAANITDISAAPTSASDAAASANSASNSATNAQKWAEGADSAVTTMGGTHSAKGWAEQAQAIVSSLGTVLHYKGSVANYAALQAVTGQIIGDVYNVIDTGDNYAWDGSAWDKLSGTVDLSAYRTSAAQDLIDEGKQPLLPAGTTGFYLQKTADGVQWAGVQTSSFPTITWYTNNTGTTVTIADTSAANLVKIYKNGLLLQPTEDYTISGTTLTMVTALVLTDKITVEAF